MKKQPEYLYYFKNPEEVLKLSTKEWNKIRGAYLQASIVTRKKYFEDYVNYCEWLFKKADKKKRVNFDQKYISNEIKRLGIAINVIKRIIKGLPPK